MAKPSPPITLDAFDLAILTILQRDNTTPQRVIGEAVNLSAPAVQRRIKRMEESGVIQANVAIVDPARVGQPITGRTGPLFASHRDSAGFSNNEPCPTTRPAQFRRFPASWRRLRALSWRVWSNYRRQASYLDRRGNGTATNRRFVGVRWLFFGEVRHLRSKFEGNAGLRSSSTAALALTLVPVRDTLLSPAPAQRHRVPQPGSGRAAALRRHQALSWLVTASTLQVCRTTGAAGPHRGRGSNPVSG